MQARRSRRPMTLGRKNYLLLRPTEGSYNEDGLWVDGGVKEISFTANIQGGLFWNSMKFSTSGDITRQAISIRSDIPIYMNTKNQKADIVVYEGCRWEVRDSRPYTNLRHTNHYEAMAVLMDGEEIERKETL